MVGQLMVEKMVMLDGVGSGRWEREDEKKERW
jgi:hypothetical protein